MSKTIWEGPSALTGERIRAVLTEWSKNTKLTGRAARSGDARTSNAATRVSMRHAMAGRSFIGVGFAPGVNRRR